VSLSGKCFLAGPFPLKCYFRRRFHAFCSNSKFITAADLTKSYRVWYLFVRLTRPTRANGRRKQLVTASQQCLRSISQLIALLTVACIHNFHNAGYMQAGNNLLFPLIPKFATYCICGSKTLGIFISVPTTIIHSNCRNIQISCK
jgi:hypothetical protein